MSRISIIVSGTIHVLFIFILVRFGAPHLAPMRLPGTAHGTHVVLFYSPGRASNESSNELKKPTRTVNKASLLMPHRQIATSKPEQKNSPPLLAESPNQNTPAVGNDALGTGDISIALMSFFPPPKPDLQKLPPGSAGDVVLDVVIDAQGKIVQLTKTKGLGFGIDESVIATVQTWTFQPATRNGTPVASEQELHFHYERS